jgi:hypothetical protein
MYKMLKREMDLRLTMPFSLEISWMMFTMMNQKDAGLSRRE